MLRFAQRQVCYANIGPPPYRFVGIYFKDGSRKYLCYLFATSGAPRRSPTEFDMICFKNNRHEEN